ncbi:MAG: MFS transporter [Dongiaceae bacterium]
MTRLHLTVAFLGHKTCRNFNFHAAILQVYLLAEGVSIETIFFAYGIWSIAKMVFEVPTGIFADRFGRRFSLIVGIAVRSLGLIWLFASADPASVLGSFVLMSLGSAFISGSDSALLYDAVHDGSGDGAYRRLESWGYIVELAVYGGSATIGSLLTDRIGLAMPVLLSALGSAIGILFVVMLPADKRAGREASRAQSPLLQFLRVMREILRHPPLRAAAIAFVAFNVIIDAGTLLYQPILIEQGVATIWFGVGLGALMLADMAGVWLGNRRPLSQLSRGQSALLVNAIFAGFILCCIVAGWLPAPLALMMVWLGYVLHSAGDGLQYPLVRVWANEAFSGPERATMLSVLSGASLLVIGVIHSINGVLIGIGGTQLAFAALLVIGAAGAIGCRSASRHAFLFPKRRAPSP